MENNEDIHEIKYNEMMLKEYKRKYEEASEYIQNLYNENNISKYLYIIQNKKSLFLQ